MNRTQLEEMGQDIRERQGSLDAAKAALAAQPALAAMFAAPMAEKEKELSELKTSFYKMEQYLEAIDSLQPLVDAIFAGESGLNNLYVHPIVQDGVRSIIIERDHACKGKPSKGTSEGGKRAIRIIKNVIVNGTLTTEDKGQFANATDACKVLDLAIGGDSARRVLERNGYTVLDA